MCHFCLEPKEKKPIFCYYDYTLVFIYIIIFLFCLMYHFTSNLATLNTTSTPSKQHHSAAAATRPPSKTRSMRPASAAAITSAAPFSEEYSAAAATHNLQKAKSSRIEALKSDNRDLQPQIAKQSSRKYQDRK